MRLGTFRHTTENASGGMASWDWIHAELLVLYRNDLLLLGVLHIFRHKNGVDWRSCVICPGRSRFRQSLVKRLKVEEPIVAAQGDLIMKPLASNRRQSC
jgi:hypothetical protein